MKDLTCEQCILAGQHKELDFMAQVDTTTRALAAADKVVSAVVMHAKLNIR